MVNQLQILILNSDFVSGKDYSLCPPKSATGSDIDISLFTEILFQVLKRVYLRKSAIVYIQEEACLIEEGEQSCLNSNGYFVCSFTHVIITEDCIEAEEYLEDDTGSSVADENDIAKRLFSEEDETCKKIIICVIQLKLSSMADIIGEVAFFPESGVYIF